MDTLAGIKQELDESGVDEGAARKFPDIFRTEGSITTDRAEFGGMDQIVQSSYLPAINFAHRIFQLKQEQPADVTEDQPQFSFVEVDVGLDPPQPLDSSDSLCVDPLLFPIYEPHEVKREVKVKQEPDEADISLVGVDQHSSAELHSDQGIPQSADDSRSATCPAVGIHIDEEMSKLERVNSACKITQIHGNLHEDTSVLQSIFQHEGYSGLEALVSRKQIVLHVVRFHTSEKKREDVQSIASSSQHDKLIDVTYILSCEKKWVCGQCDKQFTTEDNLAKHKNIHSRANTFDCTYCNLRFTHRATLSKHEKIHRAKPFACTDCDMRFTDPSNLSKHKNIHSSTRSFACTDCDRMFTRSSNLAMHQRIHIGERVFVCTNCDKRFTQRTNLVAHMYIHSGVKAFTCKDCNKSFTSPSNLAQHKKIHSAVKPFACTDCDKRFTRQEYLANHKNIHSGAEPFACTDCDLSFTHPSALSKHKKIHSAV